MHCSDRLKKSIGMLLIASMLFTLPEVSYGATMADIAVDAEEGIAVEAIEAPAEENMEDGGADTDQEWEEIEVTDGDEITAETIEENLNGDVFAETSPLNGGALEESLEGDDDTAQYEYVYFGSYPQTEVTGSELTDAIKHATYDEENDYTAKVGCYRYRRLSRNMATYTTTGDSSYFDWSESDDGQGYHYFRYEPIKWRVLREEGDNLLLLAETALDDIEYYDTRRDVTWSYSTVRNYLKYDFYDRAFTDKERISISSNTSINGNNPKYGTDGGYDTLDKVFLLSANEVSSNDCKFPEADTVRSAARRCQSTDYAKAMGVKSSTEEGYKGNCSWWLRTPGGISRNASKVREYGNVDLYGSSVNDYSIALRPALYVPRSSCSSERPVWKGPKDPTYDAGNDTAVYDYVYFGSYPQTEVTGSELTSEIINADYSESNDYTVSLNGVRYRRLSSSMATYVFTGSTVSVSSNYFDWSQGGYHYFRYEPIKWRVLQNDGENMLLLAETALDDQQYNSTYGNVTWENSTVRSYLNGEFSNRAFTDEERDVISVNQASGINSPEYGTGAGNDKVFLVSVNDIVNSNYGFSPDEQKTSVTRYCQSTDYAKAMGVWSSTEEESKGNCHWWLQSLDNYPYNAARTRSDGIVDTGVSVAGKLNALRPAIYVPLSASHLWKAEQEDNASTGPKNPVYDADKDTVSCDYVYFGSYPQTEVSGNELTDAITNAVYNEENDYTATVEGVRYRRLNRDMATHAGTGSNGYFDWSDDGDGKAYHYFRYEPIKWRVLQNNGKNLLLLAETALDDKKYNNTRASATWENSTVRSYLNGEFYNRAFTGEERKDVSANKIVNTDNPEYGTDGGSSTDDKVFLLAIDDVLNSAYGFISREGTRSATRQCSTTDYAKAMGVQSNVEEDYGGNCSWWLRSSESDSRKALEVDSYGNVDRYGYYVNSDNFALRPVISVSVSSKLWRTEAAVSSIPNSPEYDSDTDTATYDYVTFGSYPQKEVTGSELTNAIINADYNEGNDYTATVGGVRYRRLDSSMATFVGPSGEACYFDWTKGGDGSGYHYFRYEPIKWRVLESNGESLFLLAEKALDDKQYNGYSDVVWENSAVRNYLNKDFIERAFTKEERESISANKLSADNSNNNSVSKNDTISKNNTVSGNDKIFLLSMNEVSSDTYGFSNEKEKTSATRHCKGTDYAKAMGTWSSAEKEYVGNCYWWLRTPRTVSGNAPHVHPDGYANKAGASVEEYVIGALRPALYIPVSCPYWSLSSGSDEEEDESTHYNRFIDAETYGALSDEEKEITGYVTVTMSGRGEFVYTGEEIRPRVTVKYTYQEYDDSGTKSGRLKTRKLTENADYTLAYENNIHATGNSSGGVPAVLVRGIGDYSGEIKKPFSIAKKSIAKVKAEPLGDFVGRGSDLTDEIKDALVLKDGDRTVVSSDYTVSFSGSTKGNSAQDTVLTLTIRASDGGNYTGEMKIKPTVVILSGPAGRINLSSNSAGFEIIFKKDLNSRPLVYNGKAQKPKVVVKQNGRAVSKKNYGLVYRDNVDAGIASVTVVGKNGYYGEKRLTFSIIRKKISGVKVKALPKVTYRNTLDNINLIVKDGKKTLRQGTDYSVRFEENLSLSGRPKKISAFITLLSKNYEGGTKNIRCTITPRSLTNRLCTKITTKAGSSGLEAVITYNGEELKKDVDYTIQSVMKGGNTVMKIQGIGNYSGKRTIKK